MIEVRLNEPEPDDDPENRYDCVVCMHAPYADEHIVLVADDADAIESAFCVDCATALLMGVTP